MTKRDMIFIDRTRWWTGCTGVFLTQNNWCLKNYFRIFFRMPIVSRRQNSLVCHIGMFLKKIFAIDKTPKKSLNNPMTNMTFFYLFAHWTIHVVCIRSDWTFSLKKCILMKNVRKIKKNNNKHSLEKVGSQKLIRCWKR